MTDRLDRRRLLYGIAIASTAGFAGRSIANGDDHDGDGSDPNEDGNESEGDDGDATDDGNDSDESDDGDNGGDEHDEHDGGDDDGRDLNDADVRFLRMMIPHHEQAIEMAELVPDRTDRRELCEIAEGIIAVQDEEIELMETWLEQAGHDPYDHEMDHEEMAGMLSAEEMEALAAADGAEFDRLFLRGMIDHHEGAIEMSEEVLAEGSDEEVAAFAEEVIDLQRSEIETMREWCRAWF